MSKNPIADDWIEYRDALSASEMAQGSHRLLCTLWDNHPSIMRALKARHPSNDNKPAKPTYPLGNPTPAKVVRIVRPALPKTSITPWPKWYVPPVLDRKTGTELLREIAADFRTTVSVLKGQQRTSDLINARAVFVMVMRSRGLSYPQIGRLLGGRDHSTVINTVEKWETYLARDHRVRKSYDRLRQREASL